MRSPSSIDHRLAIVLFATDACFLLLHFVNGPGLPLNNPLLSISADKGYAELFQYTKELWILLLLAILATRRRSPLLLMLSLLFLYLLLDDSRQFHERFSEYIASRGALQPHFGLKPYSLAQLVYWPAVAAVFLVPIGLSYLRSDGETKSIARWVLGLTALLALFGVAVDAVASLLDSQALETIEDAGEMLVMSAMLTFVFGLVPARLAWRAEAHGARAAPVDVPGAAEISRRPLPVLRGR